MNKLSSALPTAKHVFSFLGAFFVVILSFADASFAAATLGDTVQSGADNLLLFPKLVAAVAYVLGALCVATGVYKLRDYSNSPNQYKISDPLKFLFAGGLLVAAPAFTAVLQESLGLSGADGITRTSGTLAGAVGPATTLDQMIVALIKNSAGPLQNLLLIFAYISGAILTVVGLHRLTKSAQEGPRGPSGSGTIATFVSAGILMSSSQMIGVLSNTLFGTDEVAVYADIFGFASSAPTANAENVVTAILGFMIFVGIISFLRGIFVLRGFSDGNSQMTLMGGMSHIIAGVLCINLGPLINVIQTTLGVSSLGMGIRFN